MSYVVSYFEDSGSRHKSDTIVHIVEKRTLVLIDTNGCQSGGMLRESVTTLASESINSGCGPIDTFLTCRELVTRQFKSANLDLPGEFVNLAFVEYADDETITLTGSYAPALRIDSAGGFRIHDFPGPIVGPVSVASFPVKTLTLKTGPTDRIVIGSDGLLESRRPDGRINGDSLVRQHSRDIALSEDPVELVSRIYREADSDHFDSRSVVVLGRGLSVI